MEVKILFNVEGKVKIDTSQSAKGHISTVLGLEVKTNPESIYRLMKLQQTTQAPLICELSSPQATLDFVFPETGDVIQILRELNPEPPAPPLSFSKVETEHELNPASDSALAATPYAVIIDGTVGRGPTARDAAIDALEKFGAIPSGCQRDTSAVVILRDRYPDGKASKEGLERCINIIETNTFEGLKSPLTEALAAGAAESERPRRRGRPSKNSAAAN